MDRKGVSTGMSLVEMLTVVAIVGLAAAVSIPALHVYRRKEMLKAAAREIATELRLARSLAVSRSRNVAIRFSRDAEGEWVYGMYQDGDFDGVRNEDITRGVDVLIQPPRTVVREAGNAAISLPAVRLTDPDTGKLLPVTQAPIRFGASSLCSFSPNGSATAGSVFLSDRTDHAAIVRVYGATGRIRIMMWYAANGRWSS